MRNAYCHYFNRVEIFVVFGDCNVNLNFLATILIYGLIGSVVGDLMGKTADKLLSMEAFPAIR